MRTTILNIQKMKDNGQLIPVITAYDATGGRLVEAAGVPMILVGDSLGMTIQGHETTLPVTLEDMIYHTRAVVRGTQKALIILDLPFMTYNVSPEQALVSAGRAIQEGGAGAVKMEGGARMAPFVERVVSAGIPVMAHIGLTPQSVHQLGGWKVQGRTAEAAERLIDDALALEAAGAFAIVLETIPAPLAKAITSRLHIPTIGIGAGPDCDGQVQVFHDLLGLYEAHVPKHAKQYARLGEVIRQAFAQYVSEVGAREFPTQDQSFDMDEATLAEIYGYHASH
ncbi:MAG TPA: 3-methyl-2-oxobutanoate hydroxymethyltransferase [Aggregatilineales bacterium]|nr:3-methyl-2-oxobutanoate hydroxymethyltransferase [Aggregatilineales bacterium]